MKNEETRDLSTLINVFTENLESPFELLSNGELSYEHPVQCGYFSHALQLRIELQNEGFETTEVTSYIDEGPTSYHKEIYHCFDVVLHSDEEMQSLRRYLNNGIYHLVEY